MVGVAFICCRYNRLLIYGVKRTTKTDGMGPFNITLSHCFREINHKISNYCTFIFLTAHIKRTHIVYKNIIIT